MLHVHWMEGSRSRSSVRMNTIDGRSAATASPSSSDARASRLIEARGKVAAMKERPRDPARDASHRARARATRRPPRAPRPAGNLPLSREI